MSLDPLQQALEYVIDSESTPSTLEENLEESPWFSKLPHEIRDQILELVLIKDGVISPLLLWNASLWQTAEIAQ
jgi:hypothetical protein